MNLDGKKILKEVRTYFGLYYVLEDEETGVVTQEWEDGVVNLLAHDVNNFTFHTISNAFLNVVDGTEEVKSDEGEKLWEISRSVFENIINKIENKDNIELTKKYLFKKLEEMKIDLTSSPQVISEETLEQLQKATEENKDVLEEAKEEESKNPELEFDVSILEYKIHEVSCRADTGEWFSKDEMLVSGIYGVADATGPSSKGILKEYPLGHFKKGDKEKYSPPLTLATIDIKNTSNFPKLYLFELALAERDSGGFSEYINALFEGLERIVQQYVVPVLAASIGAAVGASVGSIIPGLGTAVGAAAGALLGLIVGGIVEFLKKLFADEIFAAQNAFEMIQLKTINNGKSVVPRLSNGSTFSGLRPATFIEHGASYNVVYSWELK